MTLAAKPYHELDREHEQARQARHEAMLNADAEVYRLADRLEERVRYEKIRRWRKRDP